MDNIGVTLGRAWVTGVVVGASAGAAYAVSYLLAIATANYDQNEPGRGNWIAALVGTLQHLGLPVLLVGVLVGLVAMAVATVLFPLLRRLHGVAASLLHATAFILFPVIVLNYLTGLAPAYGPIAAIVLLASFVLVAIVARRLTYPRVRSSR